MTSIKILGGQAKGLPLFVVADGVRPTSVMLRRKIFDRVQNWEGLTLVDLCAGTGSVGLEAYSRGGRTKLIEGSRAAFQKLSANAQATVGKCERKHDLEISQSDCIQWLKKFWPTYLGQNSEEREETIFFFDPPYENHKLYAELIKWMLEQKGMIGQLWIESDRQKGLSHHDIEAMMGQNSVRILKQGTSFISIFDFKGFALDAFSIKSDNA